MTGQKQKHKANGTVVVLKHPTWHWQLCVLHYLTLNDTTFRSHSLCVLLYSQNKERVVLNITKRLLSTENR